MRLWLLTLISLLLALPAVAKEQVKDVFIEADSLIFDKLRNEVKGKGSVKITQENQIIECDKILYNKNTGDITSLGQISITREDGNVYFADYLEFNKEQFEGYAIRFSARFANDKSLLAANEAQVVDKNISKLHELVYSSCPICKNNLIPGVPLWQIRAQEAIINQVSERIVYRNARIELFGAPVFFTPYFSMPTPRAKRKSGFLTPKFQWTNERLFQVQLPFYLNISPNMDVTIKPIVATDTETFPLILGELRHLLKNGSYSVTGSFTKDRKLASKRGKNHKEKDNGDKLWKGHIKAGGNFTVNNSAHVNKTGFQLYRVYDKHKTYLKRYQLENDNILTSYLYAYNLKDDYYVTSDILKFQDLRPGRKQDGTPSITPVITTHNTFPLGRSTTLDIDTNWLNVRRKVGDQYKRAVMEPRIKQNIVLPYGQQGSIATSFRADFYDLDNRDTREFVYRTHPKLILDWSWPLYKSSEAQFIVIEPKANIIASPKERFRKNRIPNEDSQYSEISAINLFRESRYHGFDLIETGSRVNYGLKGRIDNTVFSDLEFSLGQSYYLQDYNQVAKNNRSNIIGNVTFGLDNYIPLRINSSFRLDQKTFRVLKNETSVELKLKKWEVGVNYYSLAKQMIIPEKRSKVHRKEIEAKLDYNFYDKWWLGGNMKRKLDGKPDKSIPAKRTMMIKDGIRLRYLGSCLNINLSVSRDHTKLKNLKPTQTYLMNISIPK